MTPAAIFSLCNSIAMIGWLILIFLPFWTSSDKFIAGIIITLFAIIYTALIFTNFHTSDLKCFSTLQGVMDLFKNPHMLLAGWIHYLAFDLMTGLFIKKNGWKYGINHWLLIPCLFFTFMLGPVGLLLYFIVRWVATRNYFADNY